MNSQASPFWEGLHNTWLRSSRDAQFQNAAISDRCRQFEGRFRPIDVLQMRGTTVHQAQFLVDVSSDLNR
jgi:hypothetical protein